MNIPLTPYVLDEFYSITGCDVRNFLMEYSIFYQTDYFTIKNFYTGKSKSISPESFVNFQSVRKLLKDVFSKFQNFNKQLENIKFVELLEQIESCNDVLCSLNKINKWARATTDRFGYNPRFKLQYVLSQYDSLEKVANLVVQSNNPQNDWRSIAVENHLTENDYTSQGGNVLQITMDNEDVNNFNITSVVDVIKNKSVYGRDLDRNLHFDLEKQDLFLLNEDETIKQAIEILVTLRKRDNLDFIDHGLQAALIIGQSKSVLNFPIVERQLQETFRNDDTLKNFTMTDFKFDQDNVLVQFTIETRLNEVLQLTAEL